MLPSYIDKEYPSKIDWIPLRIFSFYVKAGPIKPTEGRKKKR